MSEDNGRQGRRLGKPRKGAGHFGHNGGGVDREALARYVSRIANLHEELKKGSDPIKDAIKEVYDEAREVGFVPKIIRMILREYRMDADARQSQYDLLDQYRLALGMLAGTPLGDAALAEAEAQY